jgi:ABC-type polysaccharide transport system permease subunit
MNFKLKIAAASILLAVTACSKQEKEDVTTEINKAGSVETAVTVNHLDSAYDVIVTTHKVWRNLQEFKTIEYRDTIPSLGETNTEAENADGDTKNVRVKKDYEIFITVK